MLKYRVYQEYILKQSNTACCTISNGTINSNNLAFYTRHTGCMRCMDSNTRGGVSGTQRLLCRPLTELKATAKAEVFLPLHLRVLL
jgi:hypothetical protein